MWLHDVRVNGVAPGTTETDMIRALVDRSSFLDKIVDGTAWQDRAAGKHRRRDRLSGVRHGAAPARPAHISAVLKPTISYASIRKRQ